MRLWEDGWNEVTLASDALAGDTTLTDALTLASSAVVRLWVTGRHELLRHIAESIPAREFSEVLGRGGELRPDPNEEANKAAYVAATMRGEVEPLRLGAQLLWLWTDQQTRREGALKAVATVQGAGRKVGGTGSYTPRPHAAGVSGYLGVTPHRGQWLAAVNQWHDGRHTHKHVGTFGSRLGAALAHDEAAVAMLGDKARTNANQGRLT
jgi:hypothetical protein